MGVFHFVNKLLTAYLKKYELEMQQHADMPEKLQEITLKQILNNAQYTAFGEDHQLKKTRGKADLYCQQVPIRTYDELFPYIQRIMAGENKVLTAQKVRALAKTAGTTQVESKYIPITRECMQDCHQKGSWFTLTSLHLYREDLQIFSRKNMLIGGGDYGFYPGTKIQLADISALLIQSTPFFLKPFYTPDIYTATLPSYEEKIKLIAKQVAYEPSLTMLGGVPTWNLALYKEVLAIRGASNLLEVWPNLQAYVHGGVDFAPYLPHFKKLIPDDKMLYHNIYNASEGYFGVQNELDKDDILLILNNGIYHEFIPFAAFQKGDRDSIPITEVKKDSLYAMVITNNSGLYRYLLGDVVTFTSLRPYKIQIIGRTQEFINAFGEDLLFGNVQKALLISCEKTGVSIRDYTIAPYYINVNEKGRHQWFVEFETKPENLPAFACLLDENMQKVNSNYAQKRSNDFAITSLEIIPLPKGFFQQWLRARGKVGGQAKVPKLANHRDFAEDILRRIAK